MKVTYITSDNAEYFEGLAPNELLYEENLVCLGAIANDGTACAVLAVGIYEDAAYIEWLYTDPAYRRKRAARSLFNSLRALLKKSEEKIILTNFSDDCKYMEDFLIAEGFFVDEDRDTYSVPLVDLVFSEKTDKLEENRTSNCKVATLEKLDDPGAFFEFLSKNKIYLLNNELDSYKASLALMDQKGKITGCLLVSKRDKGSLSIPFLKSSGSIEGLTNLVLAFRDLVIEKDWTEESVIFSDRSGELSEFVENLLSEDIENYVIRGQKQGMKTL